MGKELDNFLAGIVRVLCMVMSLCGIALVSWASQGPDVEAFSFKSILLSGVGLAFLLALIVSATLGRD